MHDPFLEMRVAVLEGNEVRIERRWVNRLHVQTLVPTGPDGFCLRLRELGSWQMQCSVERVLDRFGAVSDVSGMRMVRVPVDTIEANGPRVETRWVRCTSIIAILLEPGGGRRSIHMEGMQSWQCDESAEWFLEPCAAMGRA